MRSSSLIKKDQIFLMESLNPQTISLSSKTNFTTAEKQAVAIASKKKYRAVILQISGIKKISEISLVDTSIFKNMGPGHPQFVRLVPGSSFAAIRSATVV